MPRSFVPTRIRRAPLLLPLGATLVVLVLASPITAVAPVVTKIAPPYLTATAYGGFSNYSARNGTAVALSPPSANRTSGAVSVALAVKAYKVGPSWINAEELFAFPLNVPTNATYNISARWSVHWTANASGQLGCKVRVQAWIDLYVVDMTTGIPVLAPEVIFVNLHSNSSIASTGTRNSTLSVGVSLTATHSYKIVTLVTEFLRASGKIKSLFPPPPSYCGSSANFDLAAPYGGVLKWVKIQ